jgi:ubiquinone/menaquinone biosynthesis C-methylase UbiE
MWNKALGLIIFINGDAANLSFTDDCFDAVCCSHALYELKSRMRKKALLEIFTNVTLAHTQSGKSKLIICRKK